MFLGELPTQFSVPVGRVAAGTLHKKEAMVAPMFTFFGEDYVTLHQGLGHKLKRQGSLGLGSWSTG